MQHAELIAEVSYGHELMELEEKCDEEYTALEAEHAGVCAELREVMTSYEEVRRRKRGKDCPQERRGAKRPV